MNLLRTFVAAVPPEVHRETLFTALHPLRMAFPRLKWVPSPNLHYTLCFIGDTPESSVPELCDALKEGCASHPAFELTLGGWGVFPNEKRPRVLFAGAESGGRELEALSRKVQSVVGTFAGLKPDAKPFKAHLTVARIKEPFQARGLLDAAQELKDMAVPSFPVAKVILFQSFLAPQGSTYEVLGRFPLQGLTESSSQATL